MKKNVLLLTLVAVILVGCQDSNELRSAVGDYSYKTSGMMELQLVDRDTITRTTLSEIGSLNISSLHTGDSVMLIFNQLAGDIYTTRGCIHGDTLDFAPMTRSYTHTLLLSPIELNVQGSACICDEHILFSLSYDGASTDSTVVVIAQNVQLIATKNE